MVDWQPNLKLISDITVGLKAVVSTQQDHEYLTGDYVVINTSFANQMVLNNQITKIEVLNNTQFKTDIDTSNQLPFSLPGVDVLCTPAQVSCIGGPSVFHNSTPGSPTGVPI